MPTRPKPLVLMILDGYGISFLDEGNAIKAAKQPNMDYYLRHYPCATIKAAGIEVGLPWGEMGNSETGHQNIGSGRILYQSLPRITFAIQDKSFFQNEAFLKAAAHVKKNPQAAFHIMGLASSGGVHGHIDHIIALLRFAAEQGIGERAFIHAFLDGRDTPPESGTNFIDQLDQAMKKFKAGAIASLIGRYYAMDRNNNWDRTQTVYDLLVHGKGTPVTSWQDGVQAAFRDADTRSFETAPAMVITKNNQPLRTIGEGDAVIFTNYRSDRALQLTKAFVQPNFTDFPVTAWQDLFFVSMTPYSKGLNNIVAFPDEHIDYPLGRVLSEYQLKQLRIAESEKFAHITYFFDGGHEETYPGEERISIPSANVKDYSQVPHMAAEAISDRVIAEIKKGQQDVIIMNYANPDMVAHTGNFSATVAALEFLDSQIGRVVNATLEAGGHVVLTCDHGHAESVVNQLTHRRSTDHTSSPVPLIYIAPTNQQAAAKDDSTLFQILTSPIGVLADVGPTTLEILQIPQPPQMTAQSLLRSLL